MNDLIQRQAEVPADLAGRRVDQAAARLFPEFSRSRLQLWIREGQLKVNQRQSRPKDRLEAGDRLHIAASPQPEDDWEAEALPLDMVHEDDHLLVLNKPAGLVVHPAGGPPSGTLLNRLLHHCPALENLPRAGIVHRLDKDTSGLMVVAKTLAAHNELVKQLQARRVRREYQAVVQGVLTGGGTVDAPIGRHPKNHKKQAVGEGGKEAVTHYRVMERFRCHTHISVKLETGRTHQIRVHTAHIRHPIVGDPVYGGRRRLPPGASERLMARLQGFSRQALHACRLGLNHPINAEPLIWEAEPPPDFRDLLESLRQDAEADHPDSV